MNENKLLYEVESREIVAREQAFEVTIAVLQELHDRLTPKEADQLAARLPHDFKLRWHAVERPVATGGAPTKTTFSATSWRLRRSARSRRAAP